MKVRTTMRPDDSIEVDQGEYIDLARAGLLLAEPEDTTPQQDQPQPPAEDATPAHKPGQGG